MRHAAWLVVSVFSSGCGICIAEVELVGGTACALQPSVANALASDTFGYHAMGIPANATSTTPQYIFMKGTGSKPYDPVSGTYPGSTLRILQEAVDKGHVGIIVAYDNIGGLDVGCGDDLDCYDEVRLEILKGIETGDPADFKNVQPPNDVFSRVNNLYTYMNSKDARWPATINWSQVRVGGGSQGAGHAFYLAKELQTVAWACNLSGVGDSDSAYNPAPWIADDTWQTPIGQFRNFIHSQDPWFWRDVVAWVNLGFTAESWRILDDATADPHNFTVSDDPEAVAARLWACFEP